MHPTQQQEQLDALCRSGIYGMTHARYLTRSLEVAKEEQIESIMPTRSLRTTEADKVTAFLVLDFLKRHNMEESLKAINLETNGQLEAIATSPPQKLLGKHRTTLERLADVFYERYDDIESVFKERQQEIVEEMVRKAESRIAQKSNKATE